MSCVCPKLAVRVQSDFMQEHKIIILMGLFLRYHIFLVHLPRIIFHTADLAPRQNGKVAHWHSFLVEEPALCDVSFDSPVEDQVRAKPSEDGRKRVRANAKAAARESEVADQLTAKIMEVHMILFEHMVLPDVSANEAAAMQAYETLSAEVPPCVLADWLHSDDSGTNSSRMEKYNFSPATMICACRHFCSAA